MHFPLRPFARAPQIDFMRARGFWVGSCVVGCVVAYMLLALLGLNLGIDFVGGKLVQLQTSQPVPVAVVRQAVSGAGFGAATIQQYGAPNEYLVRLAANDPAAAKPGAEQTLQTAVGAQASGAQVRRVEFVGPQVGAELRSKGVWALVASFLAILVYLSLRFEIRYGLGAVASLFHDISLTIGFLVLFQVEISLTVLAAVLTLVGYSLNDTIVIFDRIRENRARLPNRPLTEVLNLSVNQTLSRTLMTVCTTLLVLVAIMLFGGDVIFDFALVLLVGIVLGTYSSIFVASPVLLLLEKYYKNMGDKKPANA